VVAILVVRIFMVSYGMDLASELAPFSPSSELLSWVEKRVNGLLEQLDTRATEIRLRDAKIEKLTLELAHLRRLKFGVKSESLTASERDLFDETLAADVAACEARLAEQRQAAAMGPHLPLPEKAKRERAGRQPLPEHLPRVEHLHEPETCTCGQCGQALMRIGEDVTEKLSIVPAEFFVERHIYPKYACRPCETLIAAPAVASIIDGGLAAPALLAWVMVSKYADHLPLYRLERQAARSGVTLSRSTLADWVGRTGVALEPLWLRLAELLRQGAVLHADETPVQQLDPGNGKTKRAYLWAYRSNALASDPPITVADPEDRGQRQWHGQGDRLQPEALGGVDPLCRCGQSADRQQPGGEHHPAHRHRQEELAVRRLGAGRQTRGGDPEPDRHRPPQRPRPRGLAEGDPGEAASLAQ
jgi:transposase